MYLIDTSSGYLVLKLEEKSSYLTTFTCQFGRYRYKQLPFGTAPVGDIFQRKIDKIIKELQNVFGTVDNILVVGYDDGGRDHDNILHRVLLICRKVNLKCSFRYLSVQYKGEIIFSYGVRPDPKLKALNRMSSKYRKSNNKHFLELLIIWVNFLLEL